jgi:hypothetical protein
MAVSIRTRSVIVNTPRSAHARLRPVPVDAVTIEDAFLGAAPTSMPRREKRMRVWLPREG